MASAVLARLVSRSLASNLPLNVHFDVTYRCNERCVHCYLEHEDHGELSTAEIKRVLEQLAEAGTLFLTFSGGEIFLRPDFFELLAHARKLHFDITLKTNALLINEDRAGELKRLGVRKIQVSLYSDDPAVHDAITKVPGSLERTLRAVRFLKEQGLVVKVSCPLMKQNLHSFRGVQRLADELGVTYIMDPTITPMIDGGSGPLSMRLGADELLPVFSDSVLNPPLAPSRDSAKTEPPDAVLTAAQAYDNIPCSAGHNSCYISPYGDVYPCVQMPVPTGNLRGKTFHDIWYGGGEMERVRAARESMVRVCTSCPIKEYCQRCPGLAHVEDGDMLGPSERACEIAELNARLAGVENPASAYRVMQQSGQMSKKVAMGVANLVTIVPLRAS